MNLPNAKRLFQSFLLVLLVLFFSLFSSSLADSMGEQSLKRIINLKNSIVRVLVVSGNQESSGTAFALGSPGYFITNAHVVRGADSIIIVGMNGSDLFFSKADLVKIDVVNDIAIISPKKELNIPPLSISETEPDILTNVIAIGYPGALDEQILCKELEHQTSDLKNKIKSNLSPNISKGAISKITDSSIIHDAKISFGNSGGPLIDIQSGKVIGINTGAYGKEVLFFKAIPIVKVKELMEKAIPGELLKRQTNIFTCKETTSDEVLHAIKICENDITAHNKDLNNIEGYADIVDYYDKGFCGLDAIIVDNAAYLKKYPKRKFNIENTESTKKNDYIEITINFEAKLTNQKGKTVIAKCKNIYIVHNGKIIKIRAKKR